MKAVHCKKDKYTVYCGRPSIFGNPFVIGKDGTREEVVNKYREYAKTNAKLLAAIYALKEDDILACWCKPLSCHCDIIIELWCEYHEKT